MFRRLSRPLPHCLMLAAAVGAFACLPRPALAQEKPVGDATTRRFSYQDLADARVSAELQLTSEQRTKVAALLKDRLAALTAAKTDADKAKVRAENDARLAEILTAEQKAI